MIRKIYNWCRRYVSLMLILVILFVAYTLFLQENSIFKFVEYSNTIDSLKVEINTATDTMLYYKEMNSRLSTDPEVMERVVRENFNMVREGEDVYLFEDE
ncbi:MAG: septum formation initiator family protein [Muribaculaceae bacterium]